MNRDQDPEFKFNTQEKDTDTLYREEIRDLRIEKINQRMTLLAVLLPCLIGVVLFFAYRDVISRVDRTQDSGTLEVRNLMQELEFKLADLTSRIDTLESRLTERLTAVDNRLQAVEGQLKKTDEIVGKLRGNVVDKQAQADALNKFENALSPIRKDLAALPELREAIHNTADRVQQLETAQSKELLDLGKKLEAQAGNLKNLEKNLSNSLNKKIEIETLELELLKAKKQYQQLLELSTKKLSDKLESIEDRLDASGKSLKLQQPESSTQAAPIFPVPAPTPEERFPSPGTIQEQKIE